MVLVPEQALNRYEQRQRLETSPIITNMLHQDTRMSNTLQRDDITSDEKQKLFNAELEQFLELRRQKNYQIPIPRAVNNEEPAESQLSDADVLEPIPRTMRPRATALLNRLKTRPDVITWDKTGQVKIEGESIPGSNISDLVSDAMRSRKNFTPEGSKEFFEALTKINVLKDLVRNQERWKQTVTVKETPRAGTSSASEHFQSLVKSYEDHRRRRFFQHQCELCFQIHRSTLSLGQLQERWRT